MLSKFNYKTDVLRCKSSDTHVMSKQTLSLGPVFICVTKTNKAYDTLRLMTVVFFSDRVEQDSALRLS